MEARRTRVLLVEEGWSQTVVLASALARAGHDVTVITANGSTASCRRRGVQWCSGPLPDHVRFIAHLDRMMRDAAFDHVLPLTEATMARLWDARPAWLDRVYPLADDRQRRLLGDKHLLVDHLAALGIDVPRQRRLDGRDAGALARELGLPVVVKGATGAAGARVRIVDSVPALARVMRRARELGGAWVAQELVAGPTCLVGGLFHRGRALRIYAGEKLEQHPPRTGPAIRLRSDGDPALIAAALRVFGELGWTGFASADFIRRRGGGHAFLEVNPRLWGSVAAAGEAGVDLFAPFAELLAGRVPAPDLAFAVDRDARIFPRYLLARAYWHPGGAARALRDLLGRRGDDWRDAGLLRHVATRLYWLRRNCRSL